ncbi:MAG TPA: DeoR/GlpR family DNA-binding transcription regulator [Bacilli bacterium]
MNSFRRHEAIMKILLSQHEATVAELSATLQVTGKTIREDLARLEEKGLLTRVHGGAILARSDQFGILSPREATDGQSAERAEAAERALAYIRENEIVALDGGRTMLELARKLANRPLTVITNDLYVINELTRREEIRLVVPGGYRVRNMLAGSDAANFVKGLNIDKAFLSATCVHWETGFSVYTSDFIDFKRALLQTAKTAYVIADHTKFGRNALRTFAALNEVEAIITDSGLSSAIAAKIRAAGAKVDCHTKSGGIQE